MPLVPFASLPDDARLWIFGAERALHPDERDALLAAVDAFLAGWTAHGAPLTVARDFRDDRFLLVAVDQADVAASGCSIDAMVNVLKGIEGRIGASFVDHGAVYWRGRDGRVARDDRAGFRRRVAAGEVDRDTPVFDTTLTRVGAVRGGGWERPAREGWHGRAFFRPTAG